MKRLLLPVVAVACGSSARPPASSVAPARAPDVPIATVEVPPPPPAKPAPAGEGVEILVSNVEWAKDLIVTDDSLYWLSGTTMDLDLYRAPHRRDSKPQLVHDAPEGADELVLLGDRLYWVEPAWEIWSMPRSGGSPAKRVDLPDAPSQIVVDRDLVVAAYHPGGQGGARVFRLSEQGQATELASLPGAESPSIALDPAGQLFVGTWDFGGWRKRGIVIGRVSDGKVIPVVKDPHGAHTLAADADALYYVTQDNFVDTIWRLPHGARKPERLANNQQGSVTLLQLHDDELYWAEYVIGRLDAKLWRMPKTGGTPKALAEVGETSRLVFYGPDIYWADARRQVIARVRR